jgi:hypothetical protein
MVGLLDPDQCSIPSSAHDVPMERIEFLKARISLYRRYLTEGVESNMARAYLWLIWRDEIELAAIANSHKNAPLADIDRAVQIACSEKPKNDTRSGGS